MRSKTNAEIKDIIDDAFVAFRDSKWAESSNAQWQERCAFFMEVARESNLRSITSAGDCLRTNYEKLSVDRMAMLASKSQIPKEAFMSIIDREYKKALKAMFDSLRKDIRVGCGMEEDDE
jgi:hypothetical protein